MCVWVACHLFGQEQVLRNHIMQAFEGNLLPNM